MQNSILTLTKLKQNISMFRISGDAKPLKKDQNESVDLFVDDSCISGFIFSQLFILLIMLFCD